MATILADDIFKCIFLNTNDRIVMWGDLPMIFTRDFVTRENHWQIASLVTQKSLFTVTRAAFFTSYSLDFTKKKRKCFIIMGQWPLGTNFTEIVIKIKNFSFPKMRLWNGDHFV